MARRTIGIWGLLTAVLPGLVAIGCEPRKDASPEPDLDRVVLSVESATQAFRDAQLAQDPERVLSHLSPDFYMYRDGERVRYDSVTKEIRSSLPTLQQVETTYEDLEVLVLGPDAAIVSGIFRDRVVDAEGQLNESWGPMTLLWERRENGWLLTYVDVDHYAR